MNQGLIVGYRLLHFCLTGNFKDIQAEQWPVPTVRANEEVLIKN